MNLKIKCVTKKIIGIINHNEENRIGLYAAQSAFFIILSSVPFVMLLAVLIKRLTSVDFDKIVSPMLNIFPKSLSGYISDIITEAIERSQSVTVLSIAVISMLWSSSRGMMAIYCGLNNIFGVVRQDRWLRTRIISFCYNLIIVLFIVLGIIVFLIGNLLFGFIFRFKFLWFFIILVAVFSGIYAFLPQRKSKYISQLPGAAASGVGWIGFSYLFSVYIRYFSKFPVLYGSLTALALLMLWVYFCLYMFLIGAQINEIIHSYCKNVKKV